jgi:hypothetical protein
VHIVGLTGVLVRWIDNRSAESFCRVWLSWRMSHVWCV